MNGSLSFIFRPAYLDASISQTLQTALSNLKKTAMLLAKQYECDHSLYLYCKVNRDSACLDNSVGSSRMGNR